MGQQIPPPSRVTLKPVPGKSNDASLRSLTSAPAFKGGELIYGDYARALFRQVGMGAISQAEPNRSSHWFQGSFNLSDARLFQGV